MLIYLDNDEYNCSEILFDFKIAEIVIFTRKKMTKVDEEMQLIIGNRFGVRKKNYLQRHVIDLPKNVISYTIRDPKQRLTCLYFI